MKIYHLILSLPLFLLSCKKEQPTTAAETVAAATPVTITRPTDTLTVKDDISINATATYLLKSDVKANTTGYLTRVQINPGDNVRKGQLLFSIQTKEARALGNTINKLDPSYRFSGVTSVISPATGFVNSLNHQTGDFVQEGEILAGITDNSSFGFVMNLPYEYHQIAMNSANMEIIFPDGQKVPGRVARFLPTIDPISQTERVLVQPLTALNIPENLIVTIQLNKQKNHNGIYVPKSAVLTDETQSKFWLMKLKNDTTAVKVAITKGIENDQWVEIIAGNVSLNDRVITSGNYGLENNTKVTVER